MIRKISFTTFMLMLIFHACKKDSTCDNCIANKSPVANAGADQLITSDSVTLDGKNSSDPDGTIIGFSWQKITGPTSYNIVNPSSSLTKVEDLVAGTYSFELRVTDNKGLIAKDTTIIIVRANIPGNHAPIANAGPDKIITLPNNTILLDGTWSFDPDNHDITAVWTRISGPSAFSFANSTAMQTQASLHAEGVYQFVLTVTDIGNLSAYDTIQIIVRPPTALAEVIFTGLTWGLWHDPNDLSGIFDEITISIYDSTNLFSYTPLNIFVKLEPAGTWIEANQPVVNTNCTGPYIYNIMQTAAANTKVLFISSCPLNLALANTGASVKIVY